MPFDLEKAKSGEPIEYLEAYGWVEIKFIGPWNLDYVVCAVPWSDKPEIVHASKIRMAKKKEVVRYRVAHISDRKHFTVSANSEKDAKYLEGTNEFVAWITDWQEYEIGANDE